MGIDNSQEAAILEPHLELGRGGGGSRYPNPFFDLGQQYAPRTIKELFRWCTYFFYTNPLVGATIKKISRYPITELIVEDPDAKVKEFWETFLKEDINIKDRQMEINLDLNVYGNAFASIHFPFTRFLICTQCKTRTNIRDLDWKWKSYSFNFTCPKCGSVEAADTENKNKQISDVPYRSKKDIKIIRWNPENIAIRYNEATGESHYFYNISRSLRFQIQQGEREIIQELPLLFVQAVKNQRLIALSKNSLFHLKSPTLAEKEMGWGKPLIQHVLKDLYYMAVLRRAQEAIANEHIVPFDFMFPQPNAQMDPFVHSDLGNWKSRVEEIIRNHRRDPNYKAVMPVPVGFGRMGGDGKALMITPELNYLNQTIVGGMGIPQEFLFGGLNWTGSSITLRSLQNDFQHNQTQLLKFTKWMTDKVRIFLRKPKAKTLRFLDFKMADDIQRIQQLVSLNAQRKVSDETLLTELGLDYEKETLKIFEELQVQNKMQDSMARAQAKTSGESQIISYNYQKKIEELQIKSVEKRQAQGELAYGGPQAGGPLGSEQSTLATNQLGGEQPPAGTEEQAQKAVAQPGPNPAAPDSGSRGQYMGADGKPIAGAAPVQTAAGSPEYMDVHKTVKRWAQKLSSLEPMEAARMLTQIKTQLPSFGRMVEQQYNMIIASGQNAATGSGGSTGQPNNKALEVNMSPLPEKGAPRRAGSV